MWELPESPSSSSVCFCSDEEVAQDSPAGPARGRPQGVFGTPAARALRQEVLHRHAVATGTQHAENISMVKQRQQLQLKAAVAAAAASQDSLAKRLRCLQNLHGLQRRLLEAGAQPLEPEDVPPHVAALLDDALGEAPRVLMGRRAHAAMHGKSAAIVQASVVDTASAVHFGTRAWSSALFTALMAELELGNLEPLAATTYMLYDETPLPLSASSEPASCQSLQGSMQCLSDQPPAAQHFLPHAQLPRIHGVRQKKRAKGMSKLVQSELHVSCICKAPNGTAYCFALPLTCPLQMVDRATSECLRANVRQQLDMPMWDALKSKFKCIVNATMSDRAAPNIRCEE